MATIHKDQIPQVRYLIEQSISGNHLLFAPEKIRDAFESQTHAAVDPKDLDLKIERLLNSRSLSESRAYLDSLPKSTYRLLVKAYLNLVDQTIAKSRRLEH
jgi:hypothetical protein